MPEKLNIYMGYARQIGPHEGAVLIFAHTAREAKTVAWRGWPMQDICDDDYISATAKRLRDAEHLYKEADQEKLKAGIPHEIDSPRCCADCGYWGFELDKEGFCETCAEYREEGKD